MTHIFPSKHILTSASVVSVASISSVPSSLAHSVGDTPLYAPTLVQDLSAADLPSQSDIIIVVMGPIGAGKSTFINKAAGIEETEVGHGLESCTDQIQIVRCFDTQQNRQIVFVDTPGFDDTDVLNLDILQVVADWLKLTYENDIRLSGLLFFHRISDNRLGGSSVKHLKMFQNLCGIEALKNVVLVTTMWDEVGEEEGSKSEVELITKYWNTMIELGCHTSRFYNNTESALDIVSQFQDDARCTVLIQKELVDLHLELAETSAGRTLFYLLVEFIKTMKEHLAQIESKMKQNQHSANRIALDQEKAKVVAILRIANVQRRRYSVSSSVFKLFSRSRRGPSTLVNVRQLLVSATPFHLPAPDDSSNTASCPKITPVETLRVTTSGLQTSSSIEYFPPPPSLADATGQSRTLTSSPIECFAPPPSPADATGQSRTHTVLQGTTTALKLIQQMVDLNPVPGLQCLVGVVLNISEAVYDMHAAEDALIIDLAQMAGPFMATLVEKGSINTSDSDSMKSAIEGLTIEMNRVLVVVNQISSQRLPKRTLLSAFYKAAVDECNRQIAVACGVFGIQIALISQRAIARIEVKLNLLLMISQESNKQTTTERRASITASCPKITPVETLRVTTSGLPTSLEISQESNKRTTTARRASNTASCPTITPVETLGVTTSGLPTSSPIDSFPSPPPSPADVTDQSRTRTGLQGTITALKLIQQMVPLFGGVLNISEAVNNMYATEDALIELARKAGSFMVTLIEQGSINTFSDSDSMNSVIEGLTIEMKRVLVVVNKISSQRLPERLHLSAFDKAAVDDCNRQMALAYGVFGIQIALISQRAIARIEAKLNLALEISQESNKRTTTVRRTSKTASCPKITPVDTLGVTTSGFPTSSPIECFPPPPSPADATGQSRTHTVLQGTIIALKLIKQMVGLDPVPDFQCLVGVVLKISEAVNNMYAPEDALIDLARMAGSFMVTLVEQGSINTFSNSDSMKSVIEGLTIEMKRVLVVVNQISSQRSPKRTLLSAFDKAAVDECNRQMALACGVFGIQIALISQRAIARIEVKLNLALEISQESNKRTTTARRTSITTSCPTITPVETLRVTTSGLPTSSSIECFPSPPSPADATDQSRTHTVLQGTITALKPFHQVVPLVGVVLKISEAVNNMYATEGALIELARKAGSFMVTLVEQWSINTFSDSDSMKSVIEGLTREMNRVLVVVNHISSRRPSERLLLSAFDKAAVDECNRQMALACGVFRIQIALTSQRAIPQIEAKLNSLNLALKIPGPQESNKQ